MLVVSKDLHSSNVTLCCTQKNEILNSHVKNEKKTYFIYRNNFSVAFYSPTLVIFKLIISVLLLFLSLILLYFAKISRWKFQSLYLCLKCMHGTRNVHKNINRYTHSSPFYDVKYFLERERNETSIKSLFLQTTIYTQRIK